MRIGYYLQPKFFLTPEYFLESFRQSKTQQIPNDRQYRCHQLVLNKMVSDCFFFFLEKSMLRLAIEAVLNGASEMCALLSQPIIRCISSFAALSTILCTRSLVDLPRR